MEEYTEHIEMAKALIKENTDYDLSELKTTTHGIAHMPPQVVVTTEFCFGPAEVDTLAVVGFYIPHDGQCTVAINHMDGIVTHDNAEDMFPSGE